MSESFGITMPRRFELFANPALRLPGGIWTCTCIYMYMYLIHLSIYICLARELPWICTENFEGISINASLWSWYMHVYKRICLAMELAWIFNVKYLHVFDLLWSWLSYICLAMELAWICYGVGFGFVLQLFLWVFFYIIFILCIQW